MEREERGCRGEREDVDGRQEREDRREGEGRESVDKRGKREM